MTDRLKMKITELEKLICSIRSNLLKAPQGKLRVTSDRGKFRYYVKFPDSNNQNGDCNQKDTSNQKGTYISSSAIQTAKDLAQKEYDCKAIRILETEIALLQDAFSLLDNEPLSDLFNSLPESRKCLIDSHFKTAEEYSDDWEKRNVRKRLVSEDVSMFITEKGERVRSKSEMLIANKLLLEGIPYRYEQEFQFEELEKPVYPDFTVLNKRTRQTFVFEHFGMLDKPEYLNSVIRKLLTYSKHGWYYGINFLFTFETSSMPLNMQYLDRLIRTYLK